MMQWSGSILGAAKVVLPPEQQGRFVRIDGLRATRAETDNRVLHDDNVICVDDLSVGRATFSDKRSRGDRNGRHARSEGCARHLPVVVVGRGQEALRLDTTTDREVAGVVCTRQKDGGRCTDGDAGTDELVERHRSGPGAEHERLQEVIKRTG